MTTNNKRVKDVLTAGIIVGLACILLVIIVPLIGAP